MPNKHNPRGRHHIPKMAFKVTNWAEYEAGLKNRGSLTLWITPEAIENWVAPRRATPGGQARYSDLTIETCLMLRTAFKMPLRQCEGLMRSVLSLMELELNVPDHTTVSRRATKLPLLKKALPAGDLHILIDSTGLKVFGAGQWVQEKHGVKSRRGWRKLHLAVDADSFTIVAHTLTEQNVDDPSQVGPLLDQIEGPVTQVTADGAYDGSPTYKTLTDRNSEMIIAIPPRATAVVSSTTGPPTQRDRHLETIQNKGRLAWQTALNYGQRALVETMMGCYKTLIGPCLRARGLAAQKTEAAIGVAVLNRFLASARPNSVRKEVTVS